MKQMQGNASIYRRKSQRGISQKVLKAIYLEASKYTLDLSKLVFGGIILTMIINADMNKIAIFVGGCITVTILTTIGFILYKKGKE